MMRIDKRLNLVIPIYGDEQPRTDAKGAPVLDDGKPVMHTPILAHVHSTPLSEEIVERYFMILTQTYSAIFSRGLGIAGGPAVALRLLRSLAEEQEAWEDNKKTGTIGIKNGLVEEIRRLTVVLVPGQPGQGWQQVPLQIAVDTGQLDPDDRKEAENLIVFFICTSAVLNRAQRKEMLEAAFGLWGAQITSLSSTELAASWRTSTVTVNTGEKSPAPAKPAGGPANAVVDGKPSSVPV